MEKMILIGLVFLIIEQALSIAYNFTTRARNEKTALKNLYYAELKIVELEKQLGNEAAMRRRITDKTLAHAFVICAGGIKSLPEGWETAFDALWEINKGTS